MLIVLCCLILTSNRIFLYPPPYGGHPQRKPKTAPASEMHLRSYFFFLIFFYFGNASPKTPKKWCFRRYISEVKKKFKNREYFRKFISENIAAYTNFPPS